MELLSKQSKWQNPYHDSSQDREEERSVSVLRALNHKSKGWSSRTCHSLLQFRALEACAGAHRPTKRLRVLRGEQELGLRGHEGLPVCVVGRGGQAERVSARVHGIRRGWYARYGAAWINSKDKTPEDNQYTVKNTSHRSAKFTEK